MKRTITFLLAVLVATVIGGAATSTAQASPSIPRARTDDSGIEGVVWFRVQRSASD